MSDYPLFGKWQSESGIYRVCPSCGYLNKRDIAKWWNRDEASKICANCGASMGWLPRRQYLMRLVIVVLIAAAIVYVFDWLFQGWNGSADLCRMDFTAGMSVDAPIVSVMPRRSPGHPDFA